MADSIVLMSPLPAASQLPTSRWRGVTPLLSVWLVAAVLSNVFTIFGRYAFPLPGIDAVTFLPTAISFAAQKDFLNPVWSQANSIDPAHQWRYVSHGWIFPRVVAALCDKPDAPSAFKAVGYINAAAILSVALLISRSVRAQGLKLTWSTAVAVDAALAAYAAFVLVASGRPEPLACTFVAIAAIVALAFYQQRLVLSVTLGISTGLLAATSPVIVLFAICVTCITLAWSRSGRAVALDLAVAAASAVATFFC